MEIKEIEKIIKLAKKYSLKSLSVGDLNFIFNEEKKKERLPYGYSKYLKETNKKVLKKEELTEKQERLDMLLLEDPQEYERLLLLGDIKEDLGGDNNEEA